MPAVLLAPYSPIPIASRCHRTTIFYTEVFSIRYLPVKVSAHLFSPWPQIIRPVYCTSTRTAHLLLHHLFQDCYRCHANPTIFRRCSHRTIPACLSSHENFNNMPTRNTWRDCLQPRNRGLLKKCLFPVSVKTSKGDRMAKSEPKGRCLR